MAKIETNILYLPKMNHKKIHLRLRLKIKRTRPIHKYLDGNHQTREEGISWAPSSKIQRRGRTTKIFMTCNGSSRKIDSESNSMHRSLFEKTPF
ncbi:hypothetical protein CEXT_809171 [Caerostris extrusa]|uniref:Uncharacterized protein n=1 Tax=Caerostris extrusa TaxID=172846 RepID=A0AAV4Y600_CAEEX|nr:hypothetical protein CEXT_809171 [Caerostris extrusa]